MATHPATTRGSADARSVAAQRRWSPTLPGPLSLAAIHLPSIPANPPPLTADIASSICSPRRPPQRRPAHHANNSPPDTACRSSNHSPLTLLITNQHPLPPATRTHRH
ncbi:hypothetical protein NL676_022087 [Syzygium grande]|nr:hypothetical protein NL676_022087 [Syzygium grande]